MDGILGGSVDGVLREYGVFPETGLVHIPKGYSWEEASTLSCAALTSWNALYGLKPLKPGQWVLIQGTGGVSIFALQVKFLPSIAYLMSNSNSISNCKNPR